MIKGMGAKRERVGEKWPGGGSTFFPYNIQLILPYQDILGMRPCILYMRSHSIHTMARRKVFLICKVSIVLTYCSVSYCKVFVLAWYYQYYCLYSSRISFSFVTSSV